MRMRQRRSQAPTGPKKSIALRALSLFRPYLWLGTALVVTVAIGVGLNLYSVTILASFVGLIAEDGTTRADLARAFIIYAALVISAAFLGVLQAYVNQIIGQGVMHTLRSDLHDRLQQASMRFFTGTRTGEILSRLGTDVNAVQQSVTGTFTEFITNILTLVIAFGLMATIQWQLALATLVVLPLWVYPTVRVGRVMRRLMREWHDEMGEMTAHLEETLSVSGSMLVKSFGRAEHETARFDASNDRLRDLAVRRMMAGRWFNMGTGLFGAMVPGVAYWFLGGLVIDGGLSVEEVVAFAMLTQRVFGPFAGVARINATLLSALALFERIFEYLDLPVEVGERPDARQIASARGAIAFDGVSFGYVPHRPAVDEVSFEAEPGSMIALVGPSGAGKTTVTYLLQRFYDPERGSVRLDGQDLRDLTLDSISNSIGAVMQDTYLFHTTLAENIRYGRLDATDLEVRAAADASGLQEMIDRLPDGLQTVVGERGYRLSGGEKQRVAIARAVLKDPPVLILDEATASLDSRLERVIREAMERLAAGRTTVVIAHRLSTVLSADQILVMDRGHVVERGRHEELIAQGGLYAALYNEQFQTEAAPVAGG